VIRRLSIAVILLAICTLGPAVRAGSADDTDYWRQHDAASTQRIDHSDWTQILQTYVQKDVEGLNRFAYGSFSDSDKAALADYIDRLAAITVTSLSRDEQRAYWINAYNALTVDLVLKAWPLKSIRDLDKVLFVRAWGPWKRKIFTVEGRTISLDTIEHKILRPIWQDPRTHYAVNCASVGCPNLQDIAFTAENMDTLLNSGAAAFINSPRGVLRITGKKARVSSIYRWFREDFGGTDAAVLDHLRTYATGDLAQQLQTVTRISGHDYDWTINAARRKTRLTDR